jgi:hypothetical protein
MKISLNPTAENRRPKVEGQKCLRSTLDSRRSTADRGIIFTHHSSLITHHSQKGIALVITLILLSVTLVMALAFLAISNRERKAVATVTDTAMARLAAETALAKAESQIIAGILASPNNAGAYNYGLLVSTNYINPYGFNSSASPNPTNVNYNYANGNSLSSDDFLQNVANLLFLPRVPVFIVTNQQTKASDFRFYLDLNRNGQFDDTGAQVPNVDNTGFTNGTISEIGDPQWVGVLERPDTTHGPNNKFISRYAFIALPIGNSLDLNHIHNQVLDGANSTVSSNLADAFFRNQGVGSWEINLAAFLADLNTNEWGQVIGTPDNGNATYYYYQYLNSQNRGLAFQDAQNLLAWRYNYNYSSLATADQLFPTANTVFPNDTIDAYSDGSLQTTVDTNADFPFANEDDPSKPWAGADSNNQFFNLVSDLFDPNKSSPGFTNRLLNADNSVDTYDRYTFYRLLAQLGTDSQPESGKMNLNYRNITNGVVVDGMETNLYPWTAIEFFTNAADRMLKLYTGNWFRESPSNFLSAYYGTNYTFPIAFDQFGNMNGLTNAPYFGITNQVPAFGIANIPVYVNGQPTYSSAINRLLQLAANMYDATTNSFYPSVFRPIFEHDTFGNIYIVGYTNLVSGFGPNTVSGSGDLQLAQIYEVSSLNSFFAANIPLYVNAYGIPWIIGAKKGLPNFNEFSMNDAVQITRKLQIAKSVISPPKFSHTNEMYILSVSNSLAVECWNSYTNAYSNTVQLVTYDNLAMQMSLTNGTPLVSYSGTLPSVALTNVLFWPGMNSAQFSFVIPLNTNVTILTNSVYSFNSTAFFPEENNPTWETNVQNLPALPQMVLSTTNHLQVYMLDSTGTHVIDYIQFTGPNSSRNLNSEFINSTDASINYNNMWSLAPDARGLARGLGNQIYLSYQATTSLYWTGTQVQDEIAGFAVFMGLQPPHGYGTNNSISQSYATNYIVQVPYTPTITIYDYATWQANDPLVHYFQGDLAYSGYDPYLGTTKTGITVDSNNVAIALLPDIGIINARYEPWGTIGATAAKSDVDTNKFNLTYKDPSVSQSDSWDFPGRKLPTLGWIGRIHRGTPWQSIYLKAATIDTNTWAQWTGDTELTYGLYYDASNSLPIQDRLLFDAFTTSLNDNATRGQLSVNQNHLAAWSALFSGMVVLTNISLNPNQFTQPSNSWMFINPAGTNGLNSVLGDLVTNINNIRANTNLFPQGVFGHVGDILATPQLTEQSPFLNWSNSTQQAYGISDEVYEWLPQQMMGLLKDDSSPTYVIYCYGQALRPAQDGQLVSGTYSGMVTNYQVMAESAVRAVIQVVNATNQAPHIIVKSYNLLPPD